MRKKALFWLALSAGVMLLLPWAAVTFVRPQDGMMAVILMFLLGCAYCFTAGHYAGKQISRLWWVPAVSSGAFLAGAWIFLEPWEMAFLTYAGIYFALGMEAMLVSRLITGRRENNG